MLIGRMIFHDRAILMGRPMGRAILMGDGLEYDRILNFLSGSGLVRPSDDFAGR